MSRIAVIGTGPLQEEGVRFFSGQCLRTRHFVRPLLDSGHTVHLITHPINDQQFIAGSDPLCTEADFRGLHYYRLHSNDAELILPEIERQLNAFRPDGVFGINPYPASLACRQRYRAPVWADMNGYVPAEGQTHCALYESDGILEHFWRMEKEVVRRADRISTVSRLQRFATLGELAILGRLNRYNFAYPLVTFVPNAVSERFRAFNPPPPVLRGKEVAEDAFILLWSGGFNTWTDIDTLHAVLERVMEAHPEFHFAATGAYIAGHDERTYYRFEQMAAGSRHARQYHLLGWVETEVVDALFGESNLGINIDSRNYETLFGARNRLTNMMACGLPVLTTRGTEISHDIEDEEAGLVTSIGDVEGLVRHIENGIRDREALASLGRKGREWALDEFSYERTTHDAVEWAKKPAWAPDNAERLLRDSPELPLDHVPLHSLDELLNVCDRKTLDRLRRDERDLLAIRSKTAWRAVKWLKNILFGKLNSYKSLYNDK